MNKFIKLTQVFNDNSMKTVIISLNVIIMFEAFSRLTTVISKNGSSITVLETTDQIWEMLK